MKKSKVKLANTLLFILLVMISGCGKEKEQREESVNVPEIVGTVETQGTETKQPTIDVPETVLTEEYNHVGSFTLDEAKIIQGIFLAYDDGSFDRYRTGGYCNGLRKSSTDFDGYYASNSMLSENPSYVTAEDRLVVFSEKEFKISLHPINYEVGAIEFVSDSGLTAYGHCDYYYNGNMNVSIHYNNHDTEEMDVLYVDGVEPSAYPIEISELVIYPYKGMKSEAEIARYYSFPRNGSVTISTAQGTTLSERTYNVSATYFDLHVNRNNWDVTDYYFLDCKPTRDGYAEIEMYDSWQGCEIPAGKYVMVYKTDSTYMASIINWAGK